MRHEDMDYPHAAVHCDECWDQQIQTDTLRELKVYNQLKRRELDMREDGEWVESRPRPQPKQTYVLPPKTDTKTSVKPVGQRGGILIDFTK